MYCIAAPLDSSQSTSGGTTAAGTSKAANATALQTLAVPWLPTRWICSGGAYYQGLPSGGLIETLSGSGNRAEPVNCPPAGHPS
ncbi:hypothetical protein [Actinoplanes sp. NPDC023714]|uniref:hypothetical protein n=1 Tax=Actinoplanes sp. NPDC023714 TaxID=3154322 RepID=UPI0033F1648C